MVRQRQLLNVCAAVIMLILAGQAVHAQTQQISFAPNQLAANAWYRPGMPPELINGHLDASFGDASRWPKLLQVLRKTKGSFSVFAAEIGYLQTRSGLLPLLRANHIPISVETPGFTQAGDGESLGRMEILGEPLGGQNAFKTIFQIGSPVDRPNPDGKGWFVTADGQPFIPDELLFDERIPNLLPTFDPELLAHTVGTWDQRKDAARSGGKYPTTSGYRARMRTLMQDYVRYLKVAQTHWGSRMPAISLHWNVNPGWEWRDEAGLDTIHAADPHWFDTPSNYYAIVARRPQFNSVVYLEELIEVLTKAGFKPRTIYMDVDWTYDVPYILETLKRHKASLEHRGVQMAINIAEASLANAEALTFSQNRLSRVSASDSPTNLLYERTLLAITDFLKANGLTGDGIQLRVASWSPRPKEVGNQIDERLPGSLAHTALEIQKRR